MSLSKRQVSFSSIFISFFIVMTYNSTINLTLIYFLLWTKGSYQSSNFDNFEGSGENLQNSPYHFPNNKSVFQQITLQCHERQLLCTFLAQAIHTLLKRSPLKWKSLRLLSTQVKHCQIPYTNFEPTSRFLSKFCIPLQFHER